MKIIKLLFIILLITSCQHNPKITYFENLNHDQVRIPIIQKKINNTTVSFILDSGANMSLLDSTWYHHNSELFSCDDDIAITLTGVSGVVFTNSKIVYTIIDDDYVVFTTSNLTPVIKNLNSQGFNVIGILGSDYLRDNYLIIDYNKQAIYPAL